MALTKDKGSNSDGASSQRWTNALIIIATVAAISSVLVLLLRPETSLGIEVSLPTPTPPPQLKVYLSGAVAQPGVYSFQEEDRLQEAVQYAGGLLPDADASAVNMAALLEDEQHYHLPLIEETKSDETITIAASESSHSTTTAKDSPPTPDVPAISPDDPVDINTASQERLQLLPGIGEVRAEAIIEFRKTYGPFGETSEVTSVPGIGPATFENIRHLITVDTSIP